MNASPTLRLGFRAVAITAAASLLFACSSDDADSTSDVAVESAATSISIELARSPIQADGETVTSVYGILVNDSATAMRLVSATSPLADSIDLFAPENVIVLPSEGIEVKADGGLVMEPAGYKLRLNGIEPLAIGDEIPVTVRFDTGDSFSFNAVVQELDQ